jgi:hypothetical protein
MPNDEPVELPSDGEPVDLSRLFDQMFERLTEALERSRAAMLRNVEQGPRLEADALSQLANYSNPERRRARLIQESATVLAEEVRGSRATLTVVGETQSATSFNAQAAVVAIQAKTVTAVGQAFNIGPGDTGEVLRALAGGPDRARLELNLALARGITIGRSLTTAAAAAALLVSRWESQLETYLTAAPLAQALGIAEAFWELVAEEGAVGIAEHFLVEVVGMANPVGSLIVSIAKITMDLRRKAAELNRVYDRNDVDDMLDFADLLAVERDWAASVMELFKKTEEMSRLEITAHV